MIFLFEQAQNHKKSHNDKNKLEGKAKIEWEVKSRNYDCYSSCIGNSSIKM